MTKPRPSINTALWRVTLQPTWLHTHTHTHTHTINEARVVDCHGQDSANEAEVLEMVLVAEPRVRVDLEGVVVTGGVLKQTVVGVEHLVGEEEEPLPVRG